MFVSLGVYGWEGGSKAKSLIHIRKSTDNI